MLMGIYSSFLATGYPRRFFAGGGGRHLFTKEIK